MRLATKIDSAPCASRCRAASSLILPAPTRYTLLPFRLPKIFSASSTATEATDTEDDPTAVSVRTRLATAKARVSNWSSCARTAPTARAVA